MWPKNNARLPPTFFAFIQAIPLVRIPVWYFIYVCKGGCVSDVYIGIRLLPAYVVCSFGFDFAFWPPAKPRSRFLENYNHCRTQLCHHNGNVASCLAERHRCGLHLTKISTNHVDTNNRWLKRTSKTPTTNSILLATDN